MRVDAPRDRFQAELVRIWQHLLDTPTVGITDDFFELGGHSLLAVRMLAQVEKSLGIALPLTQVFEEPTVEELARVLREQSDAHEHDLVERT